MDPRTRTSQRLAGAAFLLAACAALSAISGCGANPVSSAYQSAKNLCLVPCDELLLTGKGQDGIPPMTDPLYVSSTSAFVSYLLDTDRVLAFPYGVHTYALPVRVLNYHEIANHDATYGPGNFAVTYDPLTRSGTCVDLNSLQSSLGTAGLVYQSNFVMYDRAEKGLWVQMMSQCVKGNRKSQRLTLGSVFETTWGMLKSVVPDALAAAAPFGTGFDYGLDPYASYHALPATSGTTLYPLSRTDPQLPMREEVIGIPPYASPEGANRVYALSHLAVNPVVNQRVGGVDVVVLYHQASDTAVIYQRPQTPSGTASTCPPDGSHICFTLTSSAAPYTFSVTDDATGSVWNLRGAALSGPMVGTHMTPVATVSRAYWFAWAAIFPGADVW